MTAFTIVHVETGRYLYGGPLQVYYLLRGLTARGVRNILVCPQGSAIAHAAAEVAEVRAMPMRGDLDVGFIRRLRRLLRAERPALLHLHSRRGADVLGGIAARLAGVPVIVHTFHGHVFESYFSRLTTNVFIDLERIVAAMALDGSQPGPA